MTLNSTMLTLLIFFVLFLLSVSLITVYVELKNMNRLLGFVLDMLDFNTDYVESLLLEQHKKTRKETQEIKHRLTTLKDRADEMRKLHNYKAPTRAKSNVPGVWQDIG